jgi:uncharacterized delta-60 repeat protein
MKQFLSLLAIIILTRATYAQNSWTNRYAGPANANDEAYAIALDINSNVFVTGWSIGTSSSYDFATIKYSRAGVPLWTNLYNGPGNGVDEGTAVAVDTNGNSFVTGYSIGSNGDYDYATVKYSAAGAQQWVNRYNGPGNSTDLAYAVAVDPNSDVVVTGYSKNGNGDYDFATIKYSNAGSALWTNRYNGPGNGADQATAMVLDASGNVFVTGYSTGSGGDFDYATVKYSSAGLPLWTNRYNGPGNGIDEPWAIAVDKSGNAIVTGVSMGVSNYDYATIKYSSAGVPLWTNRYDGPGSGFDFAKSITLDSGNNVIVTGWSTNTTGGNDYATIKYSSAGVPLWTNRYNGPGNGDDFATKVGVDTNNNVFVTGYTTGTNGDYDYATIGYSSAGVALSTNRYIGPGNYHDVSEAILVDNAGNVFITGYSTGSGGNFDYLTIKYPAFAVNPPPFAVVTSDGLFGVSNGVFGFSYSAPANSNVVIQVSTNFQAWVPLKTNGPSTSYFSDPLSVTNTKRYYRAVVGP